MKPKGHPEKLPSAPLQEVVFELTWSLETDSNGNPSDHDYEYALGVFRGKVKEEFPHDVRLLPELPSEINIQVFSLPRHQFWTAPKTWPVVQLGPGILVLNDVEKNYTWQAFRSKVLMVKDALERAYEKPLTYTALRLKYIDAFETGGIAVFDFMNANFNVQLSNSFDVNQTPSNLSIAQRFEIEHKVYADFRIDSAENIHGKPIILWQSAYVFEHSFQAAHIETMLDVAHTFLSHKFKVFVKPELYDRFKE